MTQAQDSSPLVAIVRIILLHTAIASQLTQDLSASAPERGDGGIMAKAKQQSQESLELSRLCNDPSCVEPAAQSTWNNVKTNFPAKIPENVSLQSAINPFGWIPTVANHAFIVRVAALRTLYSHRYHGSLKELSETVEVKKLQQGWDLILVIARFSLSDDPNVIPAL
ncbi:hypothetical protein BCR44DRAFT_58850 [Catenaria anguillulae PL171]|uniref:Uncharacterized protein n=1 Tax=Catenaria anguillulae PL171 TaxID=765915 RepID=A0A1Y2HDI8_9FUNG|nr:hypothetical protein BCR44DRAFT_58850 [Catenaria anguillulae PL171]